VAALPHKTSAGTGGFLPSAAGSYASQFALVEVDSSYSSEAGGRTSAHCLERTPPSFVFRSKAFRFFTGNQTSREMFSKDIHTALPRNGKKSLYYIGMPDAIWADLWRGDFDAIIPHQPVGKLDALRFRFMPSITSRTRR
jgi:uncharacterized protein YecE (DUF72 family)